MGCQSYCDYQHAATEAFVSLSSECIYCSHPECSAAFFVDDDDGDTFLCPECSHVCHRESKEHHKMGEDERLTQRTIEVTCRPCPKCRTPTERNGGCAHMHCLRCDMEWCFVCGKTWGDECQWTHWFD
ncbi:hypothetical protein AB6A40_007471 [Gnathostoma spinigerum]|uniref:RBR-type E3 ubiquitin transferase n=1 Tax=Gnathostoma spinigerum TaxID=75299 RepID=A0ABD6EVQ0_9BILA